MNIDLLHIFSDGLILAKILEHFNLTSEQFQCAKSIDLV